MGTKKTDQKEILRDEMSRGASKKTRLPRVSPESGGKKYQKIRKEKGTEKKGPERKVNGKGGLTRTRGWEGRLVEKSENKESGQPVVEAKGEGAGKSIRNATSKSAERRGEWRTGNDRGRGGQKQTKRSWKREKPWRLHSRYERGTSKLGPRGEGESRKSGGRIRLAHAKDHTYERRTSKGNTWTKIPGEEGERGKKKANRKGEEVEGSLQ